MNDYQAEAQQTKSDQFHGELVDAVNFHNHILKAIDALISLDEIKKALFYGKENSQLTPSEFDCSQFPELIGESPEQGIDIIHSIIGKATEAGELLSALYAALFQDEPFDVTNFREEIGDGLWYDAIGLSAIGSNFGEVQTINIAKLRARFPNKFTEFDANNRNLIAERNILENGDSM